MSEARDIKGHRFASVFIPDVETCRGCGLNRAPMAWWWCQDNGVPGHTLSYYFDQGVRDERNWLADEIGDCPGVRVTRETHPWWPTRTVAGKWREKASP